MKKKLSPTQQWMADHPDDYPARAAMRMPGVLSPPNDRTRSGISASCDELTG
jgi:hypothetical protein